MDDTTKDALIQRLGLLQWANVELGTANAALLGELQRAKATIMELREKLTEAEEFLHTLKAGGEEFGAALKGDAPTENLPANPYANGSA